MAIIRYTKEDNIRYAYLNIFPDQFKTEKEKMDESLRHALYYAIKTRIQDDDLPMEPTVLFSAHMEACNIEDFKLDVKKSSYKKLTNAKSNRS